MQWEEPAFYEIKMDAEIGAYQNDLASARRERVARTEPDWGAPVLDAEAA